MARKANEIEKAYRRVALIKEIVRSERKRAEDNPLNDRNVRFGLVDIGKNKEQAAKQIIETFNDIELFLDHLHVSHIAAAFEALAIARLGTMIGETRKIVRDARKTDEDWLSNLVKNSDAFNGLADVGNVLPTDTNSRVVFNAIKSCRNDFSHGIRPTDTPEITSNDARDTLVGLLALIA